MTAPELGTGGDQSQDPANTPQNATTAPPEASTEPDNAANPNQEAAKYRRKLRDTETERDQLRDRVTGFQRAEVERLAAGRITNPAALWAAGVELESLLGPDGNPDPVKVQDAAQRAIDTLGLAKPPPANYAPLEGGNRPASAWYGEGDMASIIRGR